jgi:hypothetical protein
MFPEYIPKMQKQMGIRDDRHRLDMGSMTAKLHGLLSAGDAEGAKALVQQNANLFDKEGPYSAQGVAGMIDSGDEKTLQRLDNWAQSTTMGTLTPLEIIREGDMQQRLGLDAQRLAQNYDLGQRRIGLGYQRLNEMSEYRQEILNRGTPSMRDFEFFRSLSPEQQGQYQALHGGRGLGGGGSGSSFGAGLRPVQLSNGNNVQIDPKVHGAGANAFYQGLDANGNIIDVPISSVTTPISATQQAGKTALNDDLNTIDGASNEDLEHITGYMRGGGVGEMPLGADAYTGYKGGIARDTYSAAKRIQGNMQNKGIAAAKSMGASGINTVAEAKMYFQSMPQLDFSSPDELKKSVGVIKDYTRNYNAEHDVSYPGGKGGGGTSNPNEPPKGAVNTNIKIPGGAANGTVNKNKPDYVAYNGYWYKKPGAK